MKKEADTTETKDDSSEKKDAAPKSEA